MFDNIAKFAKKLYDHVSDVIDEQKDIQYDEHCTQCDEHCERQSWDSTWMTIAHVIAQRSIDPRLRVGAVIVTCDNSQVVSLGYNGDHKGGPNAVESFIPGMSGFIHAEINALIKMDYHSHKTKRMYVTTMPCKQCAKCIINADIVEVVYDSAYRNAEGVELLTGAGIVVRQFTA